MQLDRSKTYSLWTTRTILGAAINGTLAKQTIWTGARILIAPVHNIEIKVARLQGAVEIGKETLLVV